jgi:hypothetical protein
MLEIAAQWDDEAEVWIATSEDVPGLCVEASTFDELVDVAMELTPELLELNHVEISGPVSLHITAERTMTGEGRLMGGNVCGPRKAPQDPWMLDGSHRERKPRNLVQPNQWEDVYGSALAGIRAAGQRDTEASRSAQGILNSPEFGGFCARQGRLAHALPDFPRHTLSRRARHEQHPFLSRPSRLSTPTRAASCPTQSSIRYRTNSKPSRNWRNGCAVMPRATFTRTTPARWTNSTCWPVPLVSFESRKAWGGALNRCGNRTAGATKSPWNSPKPRPIA